MEELRMPPQDRQSEDALIGAMLLSEDAVDEALTALSEADIYQHDAQLIFSAIVALRAAQEPVDAVTVSAQLSKQGKLEDANCPAKLSQCMESVGNTEHARYYAEKIADMALRRRLIYSGGWQIDKAYDLGSSMDDVVAECEEFLNSATDHNDTEDVTQTAETLIKVFDNLSSPQDRFVKTGLHAIDDITGGLPAGMTVMAARPSVGKSALAMNICQNVCRRGDNAMFFSLEQGKMELTERMLCSEARVDGNRLRGNLITDVERARLLEASSRMSEWGYFTVDRSVLTVPKIAAMVRRLHRRYKLSVVVIDYLQLIEPEDRRVRREEQVSLISRKLKQLANSLGISLLVLAQLNRESAKRESSDFRPRISDLRESGAIEQDSDQVWLIYRYAHAAQHGGRPVEEGMEHAAQVIVAKMRNGNTGTANLTWDGPTTTFKDPPDPKYGDMETMPFGEESDGGF